MIKRAILASVACVGLGGWTAGTPQQETHAAAPTTSAAVAAPSATTAPASPQHQAAIEMLEAMNMPKVLSDGLEQGMNAQVRQQPGMAPYRATIVAFLRKYMGWDAVKDDLADIYAAEYTESELHDLAAFYRTPLGQKVIAKSPMLTARQMMLQQQKLQPHAAELQQEIQAQQAKNAAGAGGGGDGGLPGLPPSGPK